MIFASEQIDDFYLSEEALAASPSRADGVDVATEAGLRRYGCEVIQEAGILLRLPQVVMATAQVLLHRFYCKRSLHKFDVKVGAGGLCAGAPAFVGCLGQSRCCMARARMAGALARRWRHCFHAWRGMPACHIWPCRLPTCPSAGTDYPLLPCRSPRCPPSGWAAS